MSKKETSRRSFLSNFIPKFQTKYIQPPLSENPAPGIAYFNFMEGLWKNTCPLDIAGLPIGSYSTENCFFVCFDLIPHPRTYFCFKTNQWEYFLGDQIVKLKYVIKNKVVRRDFVAKFNCDENTKIKTKLKEIFHFEVQDGEALLGYSSKSNYYPEDIITISYFFRPLEPIFTENELLKNHDPEHFSLKFYLQSQTQKIKFTYDLRKESNLKWIPQIPTVFNSIAFGRSFTFNLNGNFENFEDFYFFATNEDVLDFCNTEKLEYPEDIFNTKIQQEMHGFSMTYQNLENGEIKIILIKRIYSWFFDSEVKSK